MLEINDFERPLFFFLIVQPGLFNVPCWRNYWRHYLRNTQTVNLCLHYVLYCIILYFRSFHTWPCGTENSKSFCPLQSSQCFQYITVTSVLTRCCTMSEVADTVSDFSAVWVANCLQSSSHQSRQVQVWINISHTRVTDWDASALLVSVFLNQIWKPGCLSVVPFIPTVLQTGRHLSFIFFYEPTFVSVSHRNCCLKVENKLKFHCIFLCDCGYLALFGDISW